MSDGRSSSAEASTGKDWRLEFSLQSISRGRLATQISQHTGQSQQRSYHVIPGTTVDGPRAGRLMKAAAGAMWPGANGMGAVPGAASTDNEWTLVRIAIHEAAHAVVAARWGFDSRIEIGRGDRFGTGVCYVTGLASDTSTEQVRRQIGLAGMMADLQAEYGAALTLTRTIEAVQQGPLSEGDLRLMEGRASPREIDVCQRRVQAQWDDVIELARRHLATELRYYEVRLP